MQIFRDVIFVFSFDISKTVNDDFFLMTKEINDLEFEMDLHICITL